MDLGYIINTDSKLSVISNKTNDRIMDYGSALVRYHPRNRGH